METTNIKEYCYYPDCKCPFDLTPEMECLKGLPKMPVQHKELKIKRNRAKCLNCGDIIESKYRHDFVSCRCGTCAVDGGLSYIRRVGKPEFMEELSEYEDA